MPPPPHHLDASALQHSAFYRFVALADPQAVAAVVRAHAQTGGLQGAIVVAVEGLSGAVAGPAAGVDRFEHALQTDPALGGAFAGLVFKRSGCTTVPFGRLKVSVKPEIVALGLGLDEGAAPAAVDSADATHLSPAAWRDFIARDDVVVLDNRNHFEFRLGRFRGAVDPGVENFRDFAAYVQAHADAWRAAGRKVAMYCTGGIRCDKTAPWMQGLGLEVYQLDGGILNYCQTLPDAARDWQGECFVFDRRIALDSRLQETTTTAADVYDPTRPDEAWRLARALRLDDAAS